MRITDEKITREEILADVDPQGRYIQHGSGPFPNIQTPHGILVAGMVPQVLAETIQNLAVYVELAAAVNRLLRIKTEDAPAGLCPGTAARLAALSIQIQVVEIVEILGRLGYGNK